MITIIYGPQGSGKTRNAEAFKKHFNCKRIIDEYPNVETKIEDGDLILSQEICTIFDGCKVQIIPIDIALKEINFDNQSRDQLLMAWQASKDALTKAKEAELDLRKYVVSRAFPAPKEGVNTLELGEGYKLKASVKFNYNLKDVETVKSTLYRISQIGNQGPFIANKLVKWEPSFLLTEFRNLEEQAKNGLVEAQTILKEVHAMLEITDGAPTVNIVEPKAKK